MAVGHQGPGISRRAFVQGAGVTGLGLLAGCGLPASVRPREAKVHRIAYLTGAPPNDTTTEQMAAFRQGLRDLGYVEGRNLVIDERYTGGLDQLAEPAAELVRLEPEVILVAGVPVALAMRQATATIPIVSAGGAGNGGPDLVTSGLAASHAHPGGNVTGPSMPALEGKQLQLLQETVPLLVRVAILFDRTNPDFGREAYEPAARALGQQLQFLGVRGAEDLESSFDAAIREHADGLFVVTSPMATAHSARIAELAIQSQLPSMWQQREAVVRGGLLSYGSNRSTLYRQAATYVAKILQGARPADLPLEEPREFEFVINLQTAQALGLTIPQHVLLQATEVIQ